MFTSIAFDLSLTSILSTLVRGDTLYIYPQSENVDKLLYQIFSPDSDVNTVKLTPSHIKLLETLPLTETGVELVITGGEILFNTQVNYLKRLNADIKVYNEYGPTEATIGCTVMLCNGEGPVAEIGKPIANTRIFLLDQNLAPVPKGFPGEIFISGEGVAKGYLNLPELTKDKFLDNPNGKSEYMYRTGDWGYLDENDQLVFIGRKDYQVKIRGYRVELLEIEKMLSQYESLEQVAVVINEQSKETELVAFCQCKEGMDEDKIRVYLKKMIPEYMIPDRFVQIESMPLTDNGKVDRIALQKLSISDISSDEEVIDPKNELEEKLFDIWSEVLERNGFGVTHNFFKIGGHSLKAAQISIRIQRQLGIEVDLETLFTYVTIRELATHLEKSSNGEESYVDDKLSKIVKI